MAMQWYDTEKACPKSGCDGALFAAEMRNESGKVSHMAVKCSKRGHFEKRDRTGTIQSFINKQPDRYNEED